MKAGIRLVLLFDLHPVLIGIRIKIIGFNLTNLLILLSLQITTATEYQAITDKYIGFKQDIRIETKQN